MAKGQRKRSKKTVAKKPAVTKVPSGQSCNMRMPQELADVFSKFKVKPLNQIQVNLMKESVDLSNKVSGLLKQYIEIQKSIRNGEDYVKRIESGKLKTPVMVKETDNIMIPEYNLKELKKRFKDEVKMMKESLSLVEGQVSHWYDEYRDSLVRVNKMTKSHLGDAVSVNNVSGHRRNVGGELKKQEKVILQKEFDKITDKDKKEINKLLKGNNASAPGKQGKTPS